MTPDLRASNVRFEPPLPGWLKVLCLGTALSITVTFALFGYYVRAWRLCRSEVHQQQLEITQARETIRRVELAYTGQQAARLLQDNLAAWRAGYAPATALEAAVLMATVGTRDAVLQLERAKAAAKPAPSLRPDRGTARSKEAPFLVLRGLSVEYAGAQPVLHLELVHNRESRQVVTAFSNALSKYCPAGYQFNFRPVERANSVLIDTTWRLQ